jgi:predicted Rossmann fold nucleotide-binding protein DprA/Smf involved in DNA uptake
MDVKELTREALERLLERGTALGVLVERWTSHGLWIIGRTDPEYPQRYADNLQRHSPPVLFGVGEVSLLQSGGLAVVGSRSASEEELEFAARLGTASAAQGLTVISGAAKGVDSRAMEAAINAHGCAVGVLAEGLGRAAVAHDFRDALLDGRLALMSPYEPETRWFPYTAMERNKLIYGLANAAVVVSSGDETGGTWAGAIEALKARRVPVYVRDGAGVPEGNRRLISSGARAFPEDASDDLNTLFEKSAAPAPLFEQPAARDFSVEPGDPSTAETVEVEGKIEADAGQMTNLDPYTYLVKIIPIVLQKPQDEHAFANALDIVPAQAKAWLKRAVKDKLVRRLTKPVRYVAVGKPETLFEQNPRPSA